MKTKLQALWYLIRASHYVLVTPHKIIGIVPKEKKNFEFMHLIVKQLGGKER